MSDAPKSRFSWLQRYPVLGPVIGLAFVLLLFESMIYLKFDRHWLDAYVCGSILTQATIVAIGALGLTVIIITGGIDLSAGSVVALTAVLAAMVLRAGYSSALAIVVALVAGAGIGLINGGIIAGFRMIPFIVTLGMMGMARGAAKLLGENQNVNYKLGTTEGVNLLMNNPQTVGGMELPVWLPPLGVLVLLVLTAVMSVVMNRSVFGRHVFALGSNEDTARLCGLRTRWLKTGVYALAGMFIGLAGVMQLARLRQGDPTSAIGLELDIIAAVVIGGASLSGGAGSIWGAVIGALMMTALRVGSTNMGWASPWQEVIIGGIIILAHGLDIMRQRGLKG